LLIDSALCPSCGSALKILAAIEAPAIVIEPDAARREADLFGLDTRLAGDFRPARRFGLVEGVELLAGPVARLDTLFEVALAQIRGGERLDRHAACLRCQRSSC